MNPRSDTQRYADEMRLEETLRGYVPTMSRHYEEIKGGLLAAQADHIEYHLPNMTDADDIRRAQYTIAWCRLGGVDRVNPALELR